MHVTNVNMFGKQVMKMVHLLVCRRAYQDFNLSCKARGVSSSARTVSITLMTGHGPLPGLLGNLLCPNQQCAGSMEV